MTNENTKTTTGDLKNVAGGQAAQHFQQGGSMAQINQGDGDINRTPGDNLDLDAMGNASAGQAPPAPVRPQCCKKPPKVSRHH